ncbi:MAG TPA: 4-hydroxy-3-methylbut-2-enyl diphosphate reductase [Phycisphaerae bacterium]
MKVLRAEYLGFCFGVEDALELACSTAGDTQRVYSLGPLIHNTQVVKELTQAGIQVVSRPEEISGGTVVVRAHGVTPEAMAALRARTPNVVDATCVLVRRAQNAVKQLHEQGYRVIIIGDAQHPEVQAMVGFAPDVIVIGEPQDVVRVPRSTRLGVVGQTTLAQERFAEMVGRIVAQPFREIRVVNTLCLEVERRIQAASDLCARVDVMFVLGGLHSANTRELAQVCRARGVPTYHLEDWSGFHPTFARGCRVAGVTAGASTPESTIREFIEHLEQFERGGACGAGVPPAPAPESAGVPNRDASRLGSSAPQAAEGRIDDA